MPEPDKRIGLVNGHSFLFTIVPEEAMPPYLRLDVAEVDRLLEEGGGPVTEDVFDKLVNALRARGLVVEELS